MRFISETFRKVSGVNLLLHAAQAAIDGHVMLRQVGSMPCHVLVLRSEDAANWLALLCRLLGQDGTSACVHANASAAAVYRAQAQMRHAHPEPAADSVAPGVFDAMEWTEAEKNLLLSSDAAAFYSSEERNHFLSGLDVW
jgi:hypothetical protein